MTGKITISGYLLGVYYAPSAVPTARPVLTYIILTPTLGGRYLYYSHSISEETEAQRR